MAIQSCAEGELFGEGMSQTTSEQQGPYRYKKWWGYTGDVYIRAPGEKGVPVVPGLYLSLRLCRVHAKGVVLCERACFCLLSTF